MPFKSPDTAQLSEALENIGIAARVPAEPGWYAIVTVPTKMSDATDPDAKYGKEIVKIWVFEIKEWGLPNPVLRPEIEAPTLDFMGFFGFAEMKVTPDSLKATLQRLPSWLPIHPAQPTKFLAPLQIAAIYSPQEVDSAEAALALGKKELEASTERILAKRRKQENGRSELMGDMLPDSNRDE